MKTYGILAPALVLAMSVRLRVQDAEAARQLLREHHIPFREEAPARRSLESYYFALVGGADHV